MFANKPLAIQWIENSFLSEEFKEIYVKLMDKKYSKVGLTFLKKKTKDRSLVFSIPRSGDGSRTRDLRVMNPAL
jgi:hypothetical protein